MTDNPVRQAALRFIFITILLDVLSIGIIIPVLPNLIKGFTGGNTETAAYYVGIFGFGWALMQFIAAPVLGNLSDRYGRRSVILLSNFGMGVDYVFMALAPGLGWLFAGRLISGVSAGSISAAQAYLADITPPEKRAASYGLVGAAWGLGFVAGPAIGGYLGGIDLRLPFWCAAGLSLANFVYGYFILPESLPRAQRTPFRWANANPLGSLKLLQSSSILRTLAWIYFLMQLAHYVLNSTFVLYGGVRYGWGPDMAGYTLMAVGICGAIVQGGLVRRIVGYLGEFRALPIGLAVGALGMALYGAAPTAILFWAVIPVMSFWGISGPSLQALATREVEPQAQGKLQGALAGLMGIAGMIGPLLFSGIFGWAIAHEAQVHAPGLAFYASAALLVWAAGLAATLRAPAAASA